MSYINLSLDLGEFGLFKVVKDDWLVDEMDESDQEMDVHTEKESIISLETTLINDEILV